jgi:hypothetical protein
VSEARHSGQWWSCGARGLSLSRLLLAVASERWGDWGVGLAGALDTGVVRCA